MIIPINVQKISTVDRGVLNIYILPHLYGCDEVQK